MTTQADAVRELENLASARFSDLTAAELALVRAAPKGELAVCGPSGSSSAPSNDPSKAEEWGPERHIRAGLIRWLCVDRQARELVDPKGIQALGAKIPEALDLENVTVPFPLTLWYCWLMAPIILRAVQIPGVDFQGTRVRSIVADGARVNGNVFLRNGFYAEGEVRLLGAQIGGNLECHGGTFKNPSQPGKEGTGNALVADGAVVKGSIFLRDGFTAEGEVRLLGAQIGMTLDCSKATFINPSQPDVSGAGVALFADRAVVKGDVFLNKGFTAEGEVLLLGAQIEGSLDCTGGTFKNPSQPGKKGTGNALNANRAVVKGSVFLRDGFTANGEVCLMGAKIGGNLDCTKANFTCDLSAERAAIKGVLFWASLTEPARAKLNLINASAGAIVDDIQSWPLKGNLWLDGFDYKRIWSDRRDARSRLDWLALQDPFATQPYRQLAKVLRDEGDEVGARQVLYEMEHRRRKKEDRTKRAKVWNWILAKVWSWILRVTIRYGYYPERAFWSIFVLAVLGFALYWCGYSVGSMAPTDKDAYSILKTEHKLPPHYESFHASIYSLENSFPLIKLGQVDRWQPDPNSGTSLSRAQRWVAWFLRWFRWAQIIFGWFFATMGIAGITVLVRKE